jgi:methylmalonyl-CoA mutase
MDSNISRLFSEFPPVSTNEWMNRIKEDLKDTPFEKIIWKSGEGIDINPFYRQEDLSELAYLDAIPGSFPFVRSGKSELNEWLIRQDIIVEDYSRANAEALQALNWGADSICFTIPEEAPMQQADFKTLLKGIYIECINLNFKAPGKESEIIDFLIQEINEQKLEAGKITGSVNLDPLGQVCLKGSYREGEKEDLRKSASILKKVQSFPHLRLIGINGDIFHNAGASSVQELACCLALASEYIEKLSKEGCNLDQLSKSFQLNLAVGPLFFIEIAKIRSARLLFAQLFNAWSTEVNKNIFIHTSTSKWNQTVFDPYVNMLRGTTESMSAAIAGADSITVVPFDKPFRASTKFSERIARNTQVILKEEAYFDKVIDPSAGSYYIEKITDSLTENAWQLFLKIEDMGGFSETLKSGYIQNLIGETARQRDMNIAQRKVILLGTNQYPDFTEKLTEDANLFTISGKVNSTITSIKPLRQYRGSMPFEEMRIQNTTGKAELPKVFLLTYGSVNWRIARAVFASNFFGCAGYEIIDNPGFATIKEGAEAAIEAKADIVVLCSSDDQYPIIAPEAYSLLKNKSTIVIAGYPKDSIDELKKIGIEYFIHMKSNVLEELKKFCELTSKS